MSLSMLGKVNIQNKLNSQYRQAIDNHNERVKKNRYVLNLIIDCIRFSGELNWHYEGIMKEKTLKIKGYRYFES